jgi:hypothetical protein
VTRKITWLLDLDGVVNCTAPSWGEAPYKVHVIALEAYQHIAMTWRIRWAPTLVKRILAVHRLPHVEVVWCSTWCLRGMDGVAQIRRVEQAMRLLELRCAFQGAPDSTQEVVHAAKRQAALEVLDSGADLIWTDDEVVPPLGDPFRDILAERGGNALLIQPKWNKGLTRDDMSLIESFTERL